MYIISSRLVGLASKNVVVHFVSSVTFKDLLPSDPYEGVLYIHYTLQHIFN